GPSRGCADGWGVRDRAHGPARSRARSRAVLRAGGVRGRRRGEEPAPERGGGRARGGPLSRWVEWYEIGVCGLDAALQPMGTGRGSELHLGSIVREMKRAAGENVESIPGEQEWLRTQVGFLWEAAVEYTIGGMQIDDAIELAFKRHMRSL